MNVDVFSVICVDRMYIQWLQSQVQPQSHHHQDQDPALLVQENLHYPPRILNLPKYIYLQFSNNLIIMLFL